jgi:pimeloyl-ACP methyl ester carboxylesterase
MIKKNICLIIFILIVQLCFGFKPVRNYNFYPSDFGIKYTEIKIKTKDHIELNTWVYEPDILDSNTETILFLGPDAGNMSYYIEMAANFQYLGYRVVTFDYRGFGKSSLFNYDSLEFYNELLEIDSRALIDYINFHYNTKPNVLALSLGSLVIQNSYSEVKYRINKLIIEGGVFNPREYQKRIEKIKHRKLLDYIEPLEDFENVVNNILIIAGSEDKYSCLLDCLDVLKKSKLIEIIIYNGQHLEGVKILKAKYFDYIDRFIECKNEQSH